MDYITFFTECQEGNIDKLKSPEYPGILVISDVLPEVRGVLLNCHAVIIRIPLGNAAGNGIRRHPGISSGSYIGNDSGTAEFGADFYTKKMIQFSEDLTKNSRTVRSVSFLLLNVIRNI